MNNNFNNMDDLFNQLMGNMGGYRSENRRYMINGREVTPEEFAIYRQTGQLPGNEGEAVNPTQHQGKGPKHRKATDSHQRIRQSWQDTKCYQIDRTFNFTS